MKNSVINVLTLSALVALSACSSEGDRRKAEYLEADYFGRLELPPDLTETVADQQLSIPKPTDKALSSFNKAAEVNTASARTMVGVPKVKGVHLRSDGGVHWLELDMSASQLWPRLETFWEHEGIKLKRNQSLLGFMETDWVSKLQSDDSMGFFKRMFTTMEPDKLDKFRARVEPAGKQSRLFISHTGMERFVEEDDVYWRSRPSEAVLEREMLDRFLVFMGLGPYQADAMLAAYRPFAPRVQLSESDISTLFITGSMDTAWQRTLRAADRLNLNVLDADERQRRIKVAVEQLKPEQIGGEKDEIAEASWLMRLMKGTDKSGKLKQAEQFMLALSSGNGSVKLQIQQLNGEAAEDTFAEQLRQGLAIELQ